MKCLILAAGYATRLYPLTENFPKPLLEVHEYVVISNHKFAEHFYKWASGNEKKITVVDDGTSSNETRLRAVKDIQFAIENLSLNDDMLVIAGDNLLDFSLTTFMEYAVKKEASCIMRYFEPEEARLHKSGVVTIDEDDKVLKMVEKPAEPESHWCCPPFYYYTKNDAKLIQKGIESGCGTDAPGSYRKVEEEYKGIVNV